jgi:hypothetical protein
MNFSNIQFIFNRALALTFSRKKLLFVFCILALCGVMVVFFRALALQAGNWMLMSLTFLPIFLCSGLLLFAGIILTRIYHDEVKKQGYSFRDVFAKTWEIALGASYFSIPFILCYLLLWMLLGIFVLLTEIPFIGDFFSIILAFGPFLINLGSLALCFLNIAMLFIVTPIIALSSANRTRITQLVIQKLKTNTLSTIVLAFIALVPLLFIGGFLLLAAVLTDSICYNCSNPAQIVLQWFFIMIPFTALLSPAVIFFFNFATEAHVLTQSKAKI